MCQYFWIPAGETVDEDKLRASVVVNPHGWGMIFRPKPSGKGPWPFQKIAWARKEKDNDPDIIVRMVNEEYRDFDRLIHLRYVTKGELNEENTHPFLVYSGKKGKEQVWMAHNGTLHTFAPAAASKDTRSDTRVFAEEFLAPIFSCLKNPAEIPSPIIDIVDTKVTGMNRVIMITSHRKYPVIFNPSKHYMEWVGTGKKDKKTGKEIERVSWIAANEYSFNEDHRKPKEVERKVYEWPGATTYRNNSTRYTRYTRVCCLYARAFRNAMEGDAWAAGKLRELNKIGIDNAYKSVQYYTGYTVYKVSASLTPMEQERHKKLIDEGSAAYDKAVKGIFEDSSDANKVIDTPLERFSMTGVTVGGDFTHRWPPSESDYQKDAKKIAAVDQYSKYIYPKVRMFFESTVSDMRTLSRPHGVRVWLVNNRKHFTEDDVVKTIVSMAKTIERMYEDIEVLEDLWEEEGKKIAVGADGDTEDSISKFYHQYGLL